MKLVKKIITVFAIVALVFGSLLFSFNRVKPKAQAQFYWGFGIAWHLMDIAIPFIYDEKPHIVVSANNFTTSDYVFVYSTEYGPFAEYERYYVAYNSTDFERVDYAVEEYLFLQWGGGSEGYVLMDRWYVLEVVGGSTIPPVGADDEQYYFSNRQGVASYDYDAGQTIMTSQPGLIYNFIASASYIGFVLGETSATQDTQEAFEIGRAVGYGEAQEKYENDIATIYEYEIPSIRIIEFEKGYDEGHQDGFDMGASSNITLSWIQSLWLGIGTFFGIKILGEITIGSIILIPLVISLVVFVVKLIRG